MTRRPCGTALSAAETGHLVLSTVHTSGCRRERQPHHRLLPAARAGARPARCWPGRSKAVVSQRLVRTADRQSRVAVCEILRMTGRAHDMILDPEQTDSLARGHRRGRVLRHADFRPGAAPSTSGSAASRSRTRSPAASSPHDFKLLVAGRGPFVDLDGGSDQSRAPRRGTAGRDPRARRPGSGRSRPGCSYPRRAGGRRWTTVAGLQLVSGERARVVAPAGHARLEPASPAPR